jgi:hypothetical protein
VVYRLLFDRDIRLREAWVYRKPRHPREPSEKSGEGKNSEE